ERNDSRVDLALLGDALTAQGHARYGVASEGGGRYEDALRSHREVVELFGDERTPSSISRVAWTQWHSGRCLGHLGRWEESDACLDAAIDALADQPDELAKVLANARTYYEVRDQPERLAALDSSAKKTLTQESDRDSDEALAEIEGLIGLKEVKQELRRLVSVLRLHRIRAEGGAEAPPLRQVFLLSGPDNSGKESVAQVIGDLYQRFGVLKVSSPRRVKRTDLLSSNPSAGERARGARGSHALYFPDAGSLVKEGLSAEEDMALGEVLHAINVYSSSMVVIFADTEAGIRDLCAALPELEKVGARKLHFTRSSPEEVLAIFETIASKAGYRMSAGTTEILRSTIAALDPEDLSADSARQLFEAVVGAQGDRLAGEASIDAQTASTLTKEDLLSIEMGKDQREEIEAVLADVDRLIGLSEIKTQVHDLADVLRVRKLREAAGQDSAPQSQHFVFMGPPGTGKTTVARLFGRILHSLEILDTPKVVEVDQGQLIASYVGQTAPLVEAAVRRALDGVLFIDEAYMVAEVAYFGKEAIASLLKQMEDHRERLVVIAAGYEGRMKKFLQSNPGLRSRFTAEIKFRNYSPDELAAIFMSFAVEAGYELTPEASTRVEALMKDLHAARDETFANGRTARNLFQESLKLQAKRIVKGELSDPVALSTLEAEDIADPPEEKKFRIGFE
ncbi:MAG: AAA family ATPase, partial [Solirubrobacterales bacterium]